jgi:acyl dehydratase
MSSRSAAKKIARPAPKSSKAPRKPAPRKPKAKLAKVTRFPSAKVAKRPVSHAKKAPPRKRDEGERRRHDEGQKLRHDPQPQHASRNLPALTAPTKLTQPKQSLARSFYWSELRVGDDLPPLTKPAIDRVQIVRYAAAAGDFNRLHLDEPFAHQVGFPGLFAPGMLPMAFIGQLLTAWLRRGHVRKMSARFVKIVWPGDELTCRGRIAELRKEHGACYADVELWAENQKGELVLRGQATCELYESPQAGGGDGAGLLFSLQSGSANPGPARKPAAPAKPHKKR